MSRRGGRATGIVIMASAAGGKVVAISAGEPDNPAIKGNPIIPPVIDERAGSAGTGRTVRGGFPDAGNRL